MKRFFRGREVLRTKATGKKIEIVFAETDPKTGRRIRTAVHVDEYTRHVTTK